MSGNIKIEGNLLSNEIDESESESESESNQEDNNSENSENILDYYNKNEENNDNDSEEELEVFHNNNNNNNKISLTLKQTSNDHQKEKNIPQLIQQDQDSHQTQSTQKPNNKEPKSLISAMEESVRDLEYEKTSNITDNTPSLVSMMAQSVQEIETAKSQARSKKESNQNNTTQSSAVSPTKIKKSSKQPESSDNGSFGEVNIDSHGNNFNKNSSNISSGDSNVAAGAPDVFGIVYRPYGKKKKDYNLPSGPAFEDEAEFEKDLLKSDLMKKNIPSTEQNNNNNDDDDEFDFDISTTKTFSLPNSSQISSTSRLDNLKLTTLGGKDGVETQLDGEDSEDDNDNNEDDDNEDDREEEDNQNKSNEDDNKSNDQSKDNDVNSIKPVNIRDAARNALAEITGIYSSGLGDHEVTILKSTGNIAENTKDLALAAKLGVKSGIEEVDEEELEREEEEEEKHEEQTKLLKENQISELESQWAAVESAVSSSFNITNQDNSTQTYETITYQQAESFFRNLDLSHFRSNIVIDEETSTSWNPLIGDRTLSKVNLPTNEIEFPFLVAQVDYSPDEHLTMLRTLYKNLVVDSGSGFYDCPATGLHWESLGFQGSDPRTDLNRSMKMLTILQLLHMFEYEKGLTRKLFASSLGTGTVIPSPNTSSGNVRELDDSWPFILVGITMTKHSIDALRSGNLTKEAYKIKSVLNIAHEFHHACFYCYSRLLNDMPQIHHAVHLTNIRKEVANNPMGILRSYRQSKEPKKVLNDVKDNDNNNDIAYDTLEGNSKKGQKKEKKSWNIFGSSKEKKFQLKGNNNNNNNDDSDNNDSDDNN